MHALVGATADGGPLLLALVAGMVRPRAGRLRVLEQPPSDATVRPQVAFVPLDPALPEAMRVAEFLEIASQIRGEDRQEPARRLGVLGIESVVTRLIGTLSHEEARAVAIAEAVTSARVRVLLLEEPFLSLDPRATSRLAEVLRARSLAGCTVLVATASLRDAGELADDCVFFRRGALVGETSSPDLLCGFSTHGARLRVITSDPRALAATLARDERIEAIARRDHSVTVRGRDPLELARAAGRAVVASGVILTEMRVEPPSLEEAYAAVSAMAARMAAAQEPTP